MLTDGERDRLTAAVQRAFPFIEQAVHQYTAMAGIPDLFGIGVYDASDGGADADARGTIEARALGELGVSPENWGERQPVLTARGKAGAAIRSGMSSGEAAVKAPEAFREGDRRSAGGILGEVGGKAVAIGASGLRASEDEAIARVLLEAIKRLNGDFDQAPPGRAAS